MDYSSWPHDKRQLIDDLWALGLKHLPVLPEWDDYVSKNAILKGRDLQPWRSILAVAAWLNDNNVSGLWDRMSELSVRYQEERPELELSDMTYLTIQALTEIIHEEIKKDSSIDIEHHDFVVKTSDVADKAKTITKTEEGKIDPEEITPQKMGHVLRRMRFKKAARKTRGSARGWCLNINDLRRWAKSYGIQLPKELVEDTNNSQMEVSDKVEDTSSNIGDIGDIGASNRDQIVNNTTGDSWVRDGNL
jgi:hypothetical protein